MKQLLLILPLLLFFACKKIEPSLQQHQESEPIYTVDGKMNGTSFNLTVNDTNVKLGQGTQMMNGIKTYYSNIVNHTTNESIKIIFTPAERPIQNIDTYSTTARDIYFLVHQPQCFKFSFDQNQTVENAFVYYNAANQPIQSPSLSFDEFGQYNIKYKLIGISNDLYEMPINNGFNGFDLNPRFNVIEGQNNLEVHAKTNQYNHKWYVDNDLISTANQDEFNLENGIYTLKHILTDDHGNSVEARKLFKVTSHAIDWVIDVDHCENEVPINNFDRLIIEYEKDGEVYSSAFLSENNQQSVQAYDIKYFIENQSVAVKMSIDFTCRLTNKSQTKYLDLSNVVGTFKYHL